MTRPQTTAGALRRAHFAEAVPALLLAAMFLSFIVQVFMRYVINSPVGWTVEVCVIAWLWIMLWGQSRVGDARRTRSASTSSTAPCRPAVRRCVPAGLLGLSGRRSTPSSLPALWDYVTFMKIEETSYLDHPLQLGLLGRLILFTVVSILRYLWIFWAALRGRDEPRAGDDPKAVEPRGLHRMSWEFGVTVAVDRR